MNDIPTYRKDMTLSEFSRAQEIAVNAIAEEARRYLRVGGFEDFDKWWRWISKENPYLKGVSRREFEAAINGTPFSNH